MINFDSSPRNTKLINLTSHDKKKKLTEVSKEQQQIPSHHMAAVARETDRKLHGRLSSMVSQGIMGRNVFFAYEVFFFLCFLCFWWKLAFPLPSSITSMPPAREVMFYFVGRTKLDDALNPF